MSTSIDPLLAGVQTGRDRREVDVAAAYRDHRVRLIGLATAITMDRHLAEEVVQEAFVGLHRHADRVDEPVGYLQRAVVNRSISALRRRRVAGDVVHATRSPTVDPEIDETGQWSWRWPHPSASPEPCRRSSRLPPAMQCCRPGPSHRTLGCATSIFDSGVASVPGHGTSSIELVATSGGLQGLLDWRSPSGSPIPAGWTSRTVGGVTSSVEGSADASASAILTIDVRWVAGGWAYEATGHVFATEADFLAALTA